MESSIDAGRSARIDLGAIVAHPLRAKALDVLAQRRASPTEIAHELREPVSTVSYHVRKLVEVNAVELVDERKVRGAVEHFYRARVIPFLAEEDWSNLTPEQRYEFSAYTLQLGIASIARSLDGGTFDARDDRWLTRIPAIVDEAGWRELSELHKELYERTMKIREDSANRIGGDPDVPTVKALQFSTLFEEP
jgi:DNA-binding transcriptional ArsR family regulator